MPVPLILAANFEIFGVLLPSLIQQLVTSLDNRLCIQYYSRLSPKSCKKPIITLNRFNANSFILPSYCHDIFLDLCTYHYLWIKLWYSLLINYWDSLEDVISLVVRGVGGCMAAMESGNPKKKKKNKKKQQRFVSFHTGWLLGRQYHHIIMLAHYVWFIRWVQLRDNAVFILWTASSMYRTIELSWWLERED